MHFNSEMAVRRAKRVDICDSEAVLSYPYGVPLMASLMLFGGHSVHLSQNCH